MDKELEVNKQNHSYSQMEGKNFIFMAFIFLLFGLGVLIFGIIFLAQSFSYAPVEAVCVENSVIRGSNYSTYEYEVDGIKYESISDKGWKNPNTVGKTVEIYYKKSDPNKITEEKPGNATGGVIMICFALVFVGAGALLIGQAVEAIKRENRLRKSVNEPIVNKIEDNKNKCPYCGSRYRKTSDSCPKCGASKIE